MINGVDNSGYLKPHQNGQLQGAKRKPSPHLQKHDTDKSGGISQSELEKIADTTQQRTGVTLNISEAYSKYDKDGDGELNGKEMKSYLKSQGINPPARQTDKLETIQSNINSGITDSELESLIEVLSEAMGTTTSMPAEGYDTDSTHEDIRSTHELYPEELDMYFDDPEVELAEEDTQYHSRRVNKKLKQYELSTKAFRDAFNT